VLPLFTIGHGTTPADDFAAVLEGAGVRRLVDVRIAPGSRRNPQYARGSLAAWLPERGVAYSWERRLGGFRRLPPDSPDVALRNSSFRAYAAHMRTRDFRDGLDPVLAQAGRAPTVIMCSESVWWRCHRRLVADFATLVREVPVVHLMPAGRRTPHVPTAGVRLTLDRLLVYDAG
jgi:uncharacterized protein (DUF488 family)